MNAHRDIRHVDLVARPWVLVNCASPYKRTTGLGHLYLHATALSLGFQSTAINLSGREIGDVLRGVVASMPEGALVGISGMAGLPGARCMHLATALRRDRPDLVLMWGGPLCTFFPAQVAASGLADIVVQGEGESFLRQVANGWSPVWNCSRADEVRVPAVCDLGDLPILPLALPHLPMMYRYDRFGAQVSAYDMQISRGCWGRCTFCYAARTPYRVRPASHILEELRAIPSVDFLRVIDDTFPLRDEIVSTFERWKADSRAHRKTELFCELRADQIARQPLLISRLAQCGLREVFVGVETGDDGERRRMGKSFAREVVVEARRVLAENGVRMFTGLLLNVPGQTREELNATVSLAEELNADGYYPTFVQPYPGLPVTLRGISPEPTTSLRDVCAQEWLRLTTNVTCGIGDNELLDAFVAIKVQPILTTRADGACQLCTMVPALRVSPRPLQDQWKQAGPPTFESHAALATAPLAVGLHSGCAARCLLALGTGRMQVDRQLCGIVQALAAHPSYHVRALVAWLGLKPGTGVVVPSGVLAALSTDPHTFPRVLAERALQTRSLFADAHSTSDPGDDTRPAWTRSGGESSFV